jgi:hypothetical protein
VLGRNKTPDLKREDVISCCLIGVITLGQARMEEWSSGDWQGNTARYVLQGHFVHHESLVSSPGIKPKTVHLEACVMTRAVESVRKTSDSDSSLFKPPTPSSQFLNLRLHLLHKSSICII